MKYASREDIVAGAFLVALPLVTVGLLYALMGLWYLAARGITAVFPESKAGAYRNFIAYQYGLHGALRKEMLDVDALYDQACRDQDISSRFDGNGNPASRKLPGYICGLNEPREARAYLAANYLRDVTGGCFRERGGGDPRDFRWRIEQYPCPVKR